MDTSPVINPADLCTAPFIPSTAVICGGVAGTVLKFSHLWMGQASVLNPVVRLGESREDINRVFDEILALRMPDRLSGLPGISPVRGDMLKTEAARELIRSLNLNRKK